MEFRRSTGDSGTARQSERRTARSGGYGVSSVVMSIMTGIFVLTLLIAVDHLSVYVGQRQQTGQVEDHILAGLAAGVLYYVYSRDER